MFHKVNINSLNLKDICAHGGDGLIKFARLTDKRTVSGAVNFIDVAIIPPQVSIGSHTHQQTEEEFYLVLEGEGTMTQNNNEFTVRAGDLIRNPPGGTHQLRNTSKENLRIFVFEVSVANL